MVKNTVCEKIGNLSLFAAAFYVNQK